MVMVAIAVLLSDAAVMITAPGARAVTSPLLFTLAIDVLLLDHVMGRPASTFPAPSTASAPSWNVCPTIIERLVAESLMLATGVGFTVMRAKASLPRELAAIRTVPTFRPVTTPPLETSAIDGSALAHEILGSSSTVPSGPSTSAVSVRLEFTATVAEDGSTTTDPTDSAAGPTASFEHAEAPAAMQRRVTRAPARAPRTNDSKQRTPS